MSRPIKFRAWHRLYRVMLFPPPEHASHVNAVTRDGHEFMVMDMPWGAGSAIDQVAFPCHWTWDGRMYMNGILQDIEWQQYTGINDKNGAHIYEGDIVSYSEHEAAGPISMGLPAYTNKYINISTSVIFIDGAFRLMTPRISTLLGAQSLLFDVAQHVTVIGNIYEGTTN